MDNTNQETVNLMVKIDCDPSAMLAALDAASDRVRRLKEEILELNAALADERLFVASVAVEIEKLAPAIAAQAQQAVLQAMAKGGDASRTIGTRD